MGLLQFFGTSAVEPDQVVRDGKSYLQRDELTNFPAGLSAGTHTLTGCWFQVTSSQTLVVRFS